MNIEFFPVVQKVFYNVCVLDIMFMQFYQLQLLCLKEVIAAVLSLLNYLYKLNVIWKVQNLSKCCLELIPDKVKKRAFRALKVLVLKYHVLELVKPCVDVVVGFALLQLLSLLHIAQG